MDLLYPIKLLLRKKVARFKKLILEINNRKAYLLIKSRRKGQTETIANRLAIDLINEIKYMNFIRRWDIPGGRNILKPTPRRNKGVGKWYVINPLDDKNGIDGIVYKIAKHILFNNEFNIIQLYTVLERDMVFLQTDNIDIVNIIKLHYVVLDSGIPDEDKLYPLVQQVEKK